MLKTIKFTNKYKDLIILKNIDNIEFFWLNRKIFDFVPTTSFIKLKKYFAHTFVIFFLRIMWRGKAYRVRFFKKHSKFTLNFGHSHWCKLIYDNYFFEFFKIKRQNYLILFSERSDILFVKNFFNSIRVLNKYTKRGIKVRQTPYIKRFGKISQVNSSLHSFG